MSLPPTGRDPNRRLPAGHPERHLDNGSQRPRPAAPKRPQRVPQITLKQTRTTPVRRSLLQLAMDYLRLLFDLKFQRYLTVQLLPMLYVILVIGGLAVIGQLVWDAFQEDTQRGLAYLAVSPLALLVWASACRATTEFLLVVFRMSEDVRTLASIKPTVDKLDHLFSGNHWISRLMPFMKAFQAAQEEKRSADK